MGAALCPHPHESLPIPINGTIRPHLRPRGS